MFALLKPKPLLQAESSEWLFDTFTWCLQHFDAKTFFQQTQLVLPNNHFFPGRVDSAHGMASNIFTHVQQYAGLAHWPFTLVTPENFNPQPVPLLALNSHQRNNQVNDNHLHISPQGEVVQIQVSYQPQQLNKPEDLAAAYAHVLAQHLMIQAKQLPPGGEEFLLQAAEVLAIFMGFGIMFANSAYTFRTGCGSCYNPHANRQASLPQDETIYALALFACLKNIPNKQITPHLKSYLRSVYKKASKAINHQAKKIAKLKNYQQHLATES